MSLIGYTKSVTLGTRGFSCLVYEVYEDELCGHFEDSKPETAHEKPLAPRVEICFLDS